MIQQETRVTVADNTGAKELLIIRILGRSRKKTAEVGVFARGDIPAQAGMAAIGQGSLREFRVETQRDASLRATEFVFTQRWGCGIVNNAHGQEVISDKA